MDKTIPGALTVANDVIADMAGYAALESYGVVGMAAPTLTDGIAKLLPNNRLRKGIIIKMTDDNKVHADLYVIIEHGMNLTEVSRMLAEKVTYVLEDSAQLPVEAVDVHVQGVKVRS